MDGCTSEKEWQKVALEYLKAHPKVAEIYQNDSRRTRGRKYGAVGSSRPKGLPDLSGYCTDSKALFIELKFGKGKATEEQKTFIARAKAFGCRAGIAYTISDINEILE